MIKLDFVIYRILGGGFQTIAYILCKIDLFKEVWVGEIFFWKMTDVLTKGILFGCKDLYGNHFRDILSQGILFPGGDRDCSRVGRGSAPNFASNLRNMEDKERIGICDNNCLKYTQKLGEQDARNSLEAFFNCFDVEKNQALNL